MDSFEMDLFEKKEAAAARGRSPLADRIRPKRFAEFVGQEEVVQPLREALEQKVLPSCLLWGPPGSGKTTLALLLAREADLEMVRFSAVTSGVKDIREVVEKARRQRRLQGKGTVLFVDEIHRFNKAQQDAFLPHVESGLITLIGATTENPSFEVNSALLSRCRVFILSRLTREQLSRIIDAALQNRETGLGELAIRLEPEGRQALLRLADGDAREALTLLELAASVGKRVQGVIPIDAAAVTHVAQKKVTLYDKSGEEHYNLISALHKSLRGGDADASLYWLARMLEGGEDPLYLARRMVRFASEDIGSADPQALVIALAAKEAVDFVGLPEADCALAQAALYLATAPKSNRVYQAIRRAREDVQRSPAEPVPLHLRNPVTGLMSKAGYGKGYRYAHDYPDAMAPQAYRPASLESHRYYEPTDRGFEKRIAERMAYWKKRMKAP